MCVYAICNMWVNDNVKVFKICLNLKCMFLFFTLFVNISLLIKYKKRNVAHTFSVNDNKYILAL